MKRQIKINDHLFDYLYKKNKRSKRMKISYCQSSGLTVTVPWFANRWLAEAFILKNSDWILRVFEKVKNNSSPDVFQDKKYEDHKEQARIFITERLLYYNQFLQLSFEKVFVKRQRRVWGSCSSRRNLNFNYKLLFLEPVLADYVIVHELCHLQEMNHSKKFWDLVASILPDYKERRQKLKKIVFLK
jgi:predicted metal-dependent hydrolase